MASVALSEAEKVYIVHGVQEDLRVDGRGCEDYRCVEVETDVVSNTSGSARVKLGHTDILVGVKAEMGTPKLEKPNEGYLEFFVDCSANATPEFEGRGGDDLGTEIANTLYRIFNNKSSVDLRSLCISPREHCWVLYVDVLLLECGGNLFDAISIAVKAALFNTRIPRVRVLEDEEGAKDIELSDDPYDCIRLSVENVPCIVTLCKIGCRHVVDATLQEEACSLASLLVSVTSKGIVTCMRKVGKGSLDPESIFEMMEVTAESPTPKTKKAANAKKDLVSPKMFEELRNRLDGLAQEVALLKEKQALQTVCLKGTKVNLKCLLAFTQPKTFHEASEDCISQGGTLGTPQSELENEALFEYARQSVGSEAEIWLGLNDMAAEGAWVDMTGGRLAYKNWETEITTQPDGGKAENCAALSGAANGKWFDKRCRDQLPYICQFAIV
ncbi:exosome complex component RRP42 isoform X1 [Apodemus sylvaticus]|uniref:exosome complex component RRP42 isoform X1 n=1 Tax=Apodemus sylvaticus TaxID=10129 RepID=UPI002244E13F|nr:exosome complex component RRP42 isoform X1 [Apodemus sylvaticus]